MNTDQLRDEYESTMTTEQIWLLGYWAECQRRGQSPVNMPDDAQLTPQQARDMLIEKIQAHIASWEGRETVPDIKKKISGHDICKHTDFQQYRRSPDQPD